MTGSALTANQDQVLEAFIALVRQNSDLNYLNLQYYFQLFKIVESI